MKVWYISRKTWMAILTALVLLAVLIVWIIAAHADAPAQATMAAGESERQRQLPIYNVDTEDKKVAVTFDAAWGEEKTDDLLALLDEYGVKSTFFLVGYWVDAYPEHVKEIAAAGHEIGSHSNTHPYMTKLTREGMKEELSAISGKLEKLTGTKPTLFRAPYGDYNDAVVETVRGEGLEIIQWNVDSLDWKGLSGDEMLARVKKKVRPGSIILFHNNSENLLDGLRKTLNYLKGEGYSFCKVSELIYPKPYAIRPDGTQTKE